MLRVSLAAVALVLALTATPAGAALRAYSILVPGQAGALPVTKNSTDQAKLYDALTPLGGKVTAKDLPRFFKSEALGTAGMAGKVERPRNGVRIVRDRYGVPHVFGATRADVEFGAGWATSEDRDLLLEAVRGPGRLAALDVPGQDPLALATSARQFEPSAQTEQFLNDQVKAFEKTKSGRATARDFRDFVDGINAHRRKAKSTLKPWTLRDVIAGGSLLGAVFGKGGGKEVRNGQFLGSLQQRLGPARGMDVFRDLMDSQDPESPVTVAKRFSYDPVPTGATPGSIALDPAPTPAPADPTGGPRMTMSNALLVDGRHSSNGRSMAVMGPQVGFYYPEFLHEMDLHGGGVDARGVSFAPLGAYVLVGRGAKYAWSVTSAGTDNVDQFVEELCNPDGSPATTESDHYVYKGACRQMTQFDAGVLKGTPDQRLVFRQTVHGPVSETVTAGGKPYAVALARTTRGRELASTTIFSKLDSDGVRSPRDFIDTVSRVEFTFNWHYLDEKHIAFYSSGRLPVRAPGVDPSLPTLGTGQYDWRGFLPKAGHAQAIDPAGGLLQWNNKPATGFAAADDDHAWGSIQRVSLFGKLGGKVTLDSLLSRMNGAATTDALGAQLWPAVARVLATGPADDPLAQQAAGLVTKWSQAGASRLDRNGDGKIDDPGAAIMDAAWVPLTDAVLRPVLGDLVDRLSTVETRDRLPGDQSGSSWYGVGWQGYLEKDLRAVAGAPVKGAFRVRYCGNGDLAACRASLWAAIAQAAHALEAAQGPDATAWRADANKERIVFKPGLIKQTLRWTNRSTFQQVVSFP